TDGARILLDRLQVPQLVEENVIKHESADRQRCPFQIWFGTEVRGRLPPQQRSPETQARRQCTQSNLPTPTVDVAKYACSTASVVEVYSAQALPKFIWQTAQHNSYVFGIDVVESIGTGYR
ncbi:MAG TPA: hypothetical protein VLL05_04645, partial [Terriglobales bacterium]|nr:hypothetical protein [Terriglobales bacterium]